MMILILIIYSIIAIIHFMCEYKSIKNKCGYNKKPKLDYCFFRALFFPITWVRLMLYYTDPNS